MEAFVRKQLDALESSDQEKQNKAIEKIYNLVPKKNQEKELIWALLNHVIESVSQLQFNAWRVRLTKKVAEISKDGPSVAAGLFVRSLLMRNPQAGELHEKTIETLIVSLLNQSLGNENIKNGREVAVSLFAVRYGISSVTRLFNTLDALIADKNLLEADRTSLLMLSTMGKASHKVQTIQILFDLLVEVMKSSKPGDVLPMQALLNVLSLALKDEKSRDGAFTFIATLAETCRSGFLPLVPRVISTLLTCLEQPTPKLFVCLTILTSIYGPSTGLQNHLFNIWSALQQPLHEQIYNNEANLFLAEVVRKCGYLTKHEVLLHVSREICDLALRYPENQSSHVVVAALLAAQNELAPPPVHIARTICSMYPASPVAPLLQSLADNLARPRIQDIASNYLRSTMKNQNFVFKEHLNGEEHHVHFEEQAHHRSSDDPPPDLDVNFTEDEMEEDEENPTHFGNTEPLNPKSTLFDEKPIIQINLTEDEMEEVEQPETSKAVKKIKKRKRNKEDLRNDGNQSDDSDVVNEQGKSRKKIIKNESDDDSEFTTIDIDLTEDEMEETEEHLREQKPKKLTKRSDKKDKPIPVLDVTLSEDEMELGEEASTKAGERRPSAFMLRVQAKLKQKDVERRRAETAKKKNEEQNVVEAVLGANEPTVEEIMSTFCPD